MFEIPSAPGAIALQVGVGLVGSFFFLTFLEHTVHRHLMHRRTLAKALPYLEFVFREHAVLHHGTYYKRFDFEPSPAGKEQNIIIGARETAAFLVALTPLMLLLFALSPIAGAILMLMGLGVVQTWNAVHHEMHLPANPFFKSWRLFHFLARHHFMHHVASHKNFNVVLPCADYLMGTKARPAVKDVREMLVLGYLPARTARAQQRLVTLRNRRALTAIDHAPASCPIAAMTA